MNSADMNSDFVLAIAFAARFKHALCDSKARSNFASQKRNLKHFGIKRSFFLAFVTDCIQYSNRQVSFCQEKHESSSVTCTRRRQARYDEKRPIHC